MNIALIAGMAISGAFHVNQIVELNEKMTGSTVNNSARIKYSISL